ncbi:MAG: tetratricopeptide repeat protein [Phycisphaerales bacterium]|nr:tetratricopeptide repeat protein [Phycisphaerales bacterium]
MPTFPLKTGLPLTPARTLYVHGSDGRPRGAARLRAVAATSLLAILLGVCSAAGAHPADGPRATDAEALARVPLSAIAGAAEAPPTAEPPWSPEAAERIRQLVEGAERAIGHSVHPAVREPSGNFMMDPADSVISAVEALSRAAAIDELRSGAVLFWLAQGQARLGRDAEALQTAQQALEYRPRDADTRFLLGVLKARTGDLDGAIFELRTTTLVGDENLNNARVTAAWFLLGSVLEQSGRLTAAEEAYAEFDDLIVDGAPEHQRDPNVAAILQEHPLGALEARQGLLHRLDRPEQALRVIEAAAARRPDDPRLLRLVLRARMDAGRADAALAAIRARVGDSDDPTMQGLLGLAVEAAARANELGPWIAQLERDVAGGRRIAAAAALAARLESLDRPAEALPLRRALASAAPQDAEAAWALATCQRQTGDLRGALDSLIAAVRRQHPATGATGAEPRNVEPASSLIMGGWMSTLRAADELLGIIEAYGRTGQRDFASDYVYGLSAMAISQDELGARLLGGCLEARPDFAEAHVAWGEALAARYRWAEAADKARAALAISADHSAAQLLLARALAGLDDLEAAEAAFRRAVQLAPQRADVAIAMARFHERQGGAQSAGAQRRYTDALKLDPSNAAAVEGLIRSYVSSGRLELARQRLATAESADLPDDVMRRVRTLVRFSEGLGPAAYAAELDRQFAQHPTDVRTGVDLATLLVALRRGDEALRIADRLADLAPDDEPVLAVRARVDVEHLNFARAIASMRALVERYPNRVSLLEALAELHLHDFEPARARELLTHALTRPMPQESARRLRLFLLGTFLVFDDAASGLPLIEEAIRSAPGDAALQAIRLRMMAQGGRGKEAVEAAGAWLDQDPADEDRLETFRAVCEDSRELAPAIERARQWLAARRPASSEWLEHLLLLDGRPDEALEVVKARTPTSLRESFERRLQMGTCTLRAGRAAEARAEFEALLADQTASGIFGVRMQARFGLLESLAAQGEFDAALELATSWEAEADRRLSAAEALDFRRFVYQTAGRDSDLIEVMRAQRAASPGEVLYDNNLGYTLVDLGLEIDAATAMIRRAVAARPLNASYLDSLGWAYYKAGDFAAARRYLVRSLGLWEGRNSITVLDHCGDAEYRLGSVDAARRCWERTLEEHGRANPVDLSTDDRRAAAGARRKLDALQAGVPAPTAPTAAESASTAVEKQEPR